MAGGGGSEMEGLRRGKRSKPCSADNGFSDAQIRTLGRWKFDEIL